LVSLASLPARAARESEYKISRNSASRAQAVRRYTHGPRTARALSHGSWKTLALQALRAATGRVFILPYDLYPARK
jgi:hypothetical protein